MNRFPRAQRTLLGRVILDEALGMLAALTLANRLTDKRDCLAEASGRLDTLRITVRLAKRLGYLSNPGYESLTETADEVGRMLGGWLKYERGRGQPAGQRAVAEPEAAAEPRGPRPAPAGAGRPARKGAVRYTMRSPLVERYLNAKLAPSRSSRPMLRVSGKPAGRCTWSRWAGHPGALIRGGNFNNGTNAGPFAVNANQPSNSTPGYRAGGAAGPWKDPQRSGIVRRPRALP